MELLTEFKEEVTEDFIDDVLQLEKIIDALLIDDYLEGKPTVPMIDEIFFKFIFMHFLSRDDYKPRRVN